MEKIFLWLFDASTLQNIYENNLSMPPLVFMQQKNKTHQQMNAAARISVRCTAVTAVQWPQQLLITS